MATLDSDTVENFENVDFLVFFFPPADKSACPFVACAY